MAEKQFAPDEQAFLSETGLGALVAEAPVLPLDKQLRILARARQTAGLDQPKSQPAPRHPARSRWAAWAGAAAVAAGIALVALLAPLPRSTSVVQAMNQAVGSLHSYHGVLNDGTEIWRQGDKFARRDPSGAAVISDGTTYWQVIPQQMKAHKDVPTAAELMVEPSLRYWAAIALRNPYEVVGLETVSGRTTTRIRIAQPDGPVTQLWIDNETKLPLQWEGMTRHGLERFTFTSFEVNPVIDPAVFTYEPPAAYTVEGTGKQVVSSAAEAAAIAGFTPLLPAEPPVKIVAHPSGEVILDYGDVRISQAKAAEPMKLWGQLAYGTAADGPLQVSQNELYWQQSGLRIYVFSHPHFGDRYISLARQIAPDLTLPDPEQDLVSAAVVKLPVDLGAVRAWQAEAADGSTAAENSAKDAEMVAHDFLMASGANPRTFRLRLVASTGAQAVAEVDGAPFHRIYLQRLIQQDTDGVWSVVGYDPR